MPRLPRSVVSGLIALITSCALPAAPATKPAPDTDWREYLGDSGRSHYSPLVQVDRGNVGQLKLAWEYRTGDAGEMQTNPLVVGGVLYGVTASGGIFALDAATGKEWWRWADAENPTPAKRVIRGLTYWENGDDKRLLFTAASFLYAVDARTGVAIAGFGDKGRTSLRAGLGDTAAKKHVISTTPGTLCGDLIVMPLRLSEGPDAAPGYVQAFDVRTGKLAWVFRTIPLPGEFGHETWPAAAHKNFDVGGANCWAGMAYDAQRHILFVPTGSAAPDFWGGARAGSNLFANCLVALDARTGKRLWHFQFVHHDIWDRDLPSPPVLLTVRQGGKARDVVAQTTKSGHVFVFDRVTGESIFPIEERPVSKSTVPGEVSWPTQPLPLKPAPFARQTLGDDDIATHAADRDKLLARFRAAKRGVYEPFSHEHETVILPGFDGGSEWGGVAADPSGILYVNSNEMAWMARLKEVPGVDALAHLSPGQRTYVATCSGCHGAERQGNPAANLPPLHNVSTRKSREEVAQLIVAGKGMMPGFPAIPESDRQALVDFLFGTEKTEATAPVARGAATPRAPYRLDGYNRFIDSKGYPAITPPWGTLTAIDLNTGEHRWQVPLGEYAELTAQGIAPTGTENYGGPVVTAGGLVFIAATKDAKLRAFDRDTGKTLWTADLPAPGFATPATYSVGGRQYIVIAAGGTKLGTKKADSYVAFALP